MQTIVDNASNGLYHAKPAKVFEFKDIAQAHDLMENDKACGKIVITL